MTVDSWLESIILSEAGEQALAWGLMSIAFIIFPIRLYLRYQRYHRLLSDDWLLFPALILLITLGAIHTYQYPILFRAHDLFASKTPFPPDFLANEIPSLLKTQFVKPFVVWTVQWFCKISFLLFLRRLLRVWPAYMIWWWVVLVLCTVTWLAVILINCFTCFPPKRKWEGNTCNNPHDIAANNNGLIAATVMDIISDFAIIFLPYRLILSLKMRTRHRIVVFGVFSIGFFLIFLGIWRIVLLHIARRTRSIWLNGIVAAQFGQIFGNSAVIAAILPALRLFFTEDQRKNFTQDVERRRKAPLGKGNPGVSGDTTLFSTTGLLDFNDNFIKAEKATKSVSETETERAPARPETTESPAAPSNIVRRLSSLRNLSSFIRRGSLAKGEPSSIPSEPPATHSPPQSARTSVQQSEIHPLHVKLHQVIPDIGGETSPTMYRKP